MQFEVATAPQASAGEQEAFWKRLRHFYRTGEKFENDGIDQMRSVFWEVLNKSDGYPWKKNETTIEFGPNVPMDMLQLLVDSYHQKVRNQFRYKLENLISSVSALLSDEDGSNDDDKTYDFADQIIAFDRLADLMPRQAPQQMSEKRQHRLHDVLKSLTRGLTYFDKTTATVLAEKSLLEELHPIKNVEWMEVPSENIFAMLNSVFHHRVESFLDLVRAFRMAELEVEGKFDEEIHGEYFTHFTWHRLSAEEMEVFHPVILLMDHFTLNDQMGDFSRMLTFNLPVKILAFNRQWISAPVSNESWEEASHQVREELSAISIAHRNTFVFQSTPSNPDSFFDGLERWMNSMSTAVAHTLFHKGDEHVDSLLAKAAAEGRYFVSLTYNPDSPGWSGRFDLNGNIQAEEKWPHHEIEGLGQVPFTYADYKGLYAFKLNELKIIPPEYENENLIPISDYLNAKEESLYGKIPFIWVCNNEHKLFRAAVPNVWVVSCQERLDFWEFIRNLAGQESLEKKEALWKKETEELKEQLKAEHEAEIKRIQEESVGKAAEQLISVLLDEEMSLDLTSVLTTDTAELQANVEQKESPKVETSVSEQAWIETENCTSCNECTDKYPHLFQYNDDKQAYITDPGKGTFEEMVKAAEKCPAECIHPGSPLNANEPNVEKLIKRAEKYNS